MNPAKITIERILKGYTDRLRAYQIWVDGKPAGTLQRGECKTIEVAPGQHEIWLKIDWCRSPAIPLQLSAGEQVNLTAQPNAHPLTALYDITFGRNRYIRLERSQQTS